MARVGRGLGNCLRTWTHRQHRWGFDRDGLGTYLDRWWVLADRHRSHLTQNLDRGWDGIPVRYETWWNVPGMVNQGGSRGPSQSQIHLPWFQGGLVSWCESVERNVGWRIVEWDGWKWFCQ